MTPEAGDGSTHPRTGLPKSVLPFAGAPRTSELHPPVDRARAEAAEPGRGAALDLFSAIAVSRAADARLAVLADEGRVRMAPRRLPFREAGPVGAAYALRRAADGTGDVFAPTYRAAGALGLFGLDLDAFFRAQLAGEIGPARGFGSALHHTDLARGILAPVVPLGLMVEVLGGLALGARMLGQDRVAVAFDEDGATSTGAWHEGLVFAASRRVPLVVVIEVSTSDPDGRRLHSKLDDFTEKAPGYGLGSWSADGSDAVAVVDAVRGAVARARDGEGVQMVEIRYAGEDPLERLRHRIHAGGLATPEDLDELEAKATRLCAAAAARAAEQPSADEGAPLPGVFVAAARTERRIWADPRLMQAV